MALITGASSGFGRLTAEALAPRGYVVYASMRDAAGRNAVAAGELAAGAARAGIALRPLELDVTSEASVAAALGRVAAEAGRLDVLVNNAAVVYQGGPLEAFTPEQLRAQFEVNVVGVQRVTRAALPLLRDAAAAGDDARRGPLVIHVRSGAGRLVFPLIGPYAASEWALEALAEGWRYELAALRVDTVIVEPGGYARPRRGRWRGCTWRSGRGCTSSRAASATRRASPARWTPRCGASTRKPRGPARARPSPRGAPSRA